MSLTQEELAATLNVSKSAIAKWETDGGIPDRDNLYKLAETMGVSVNDVTTGNELTNENVTMFGT